jgi:hypothetical protein
VQAGVGLGQDPDRPFRLRQFGLRVATPALPAIVKLTFSAGTARLPVLRIPSFSNAVCPRFCAVGKLASVTLTWKVPVGSSSPDELELEPQPPSIAAAASAAKPIAMARRRVCRECRPVPRKAART